MPEAYEFKWPFSADAQLVSFSGEESLSSPFSFRVVLKSDKSTLDFKQVVGKPATISMGIGSAQRHINGLVTRFALTDSAEFGFTYVADLRPWFWMLTKTRNSRIFQNKSVPDILQAVFGEYSFQKVKKSLTGSYSPREYCVQHQESDFDFVSRLMEDEGIFYFFEHTDSDHTLVLCDDASSLKPCPNVSKPTMNSAKPGFDGELIERIELFEQVVTNAYTMADYNFEVPATKLKAEAKGASPKLEVYEYPGGFMKKDQGDARVRKRIEAHEEPAKLLSGQSRIRGLSAGFKLKVADSNRSDANGEYVLKLVAHSMSADQYGNSFEAFPAATPFRPLPATPKPFIAGSQTAKVVGKSGEEIWTDKFGRVKVQFPWDREGKGDENSSCWVRVAQSWAGKQWGVWFLPRVGQEVIVTFIDGDPDRPLVTGAVYNGEQTVPYALPGKQTVSTIKTNTSKGGGGFNELRFEDEKGKEEIFIHAQKDMVLTVLNDVKWDIKNQRETTIDEADEILTLNKGNRKVTISKGNDTLSVKGTRDVTVEDNETHTNKADFTHEVKGDYVLKVDGKLSIQVKGKLEIKGADDIAILSDKNFTNKAGEKASYEAGTEMLGKAGTKMTLKAGTDFVGEGGVNMSLKAGVGFKAEGTKVDVKASALAGLEAGGIMSVKGAMVKIN